MFHKKQYIAIAEAIRQSYNVAAHSRLSLVTDKLCEIFTKDNPLFDEHKFRSACVSEKPKLTEVEESLGISVEKLIGCGKKEIPYTKPYNKTDWVGDCDHEHIGGNK